MYDNDNESPKKEKKFGPIPVEEGKEYVVDIISLGEKNDGIAKVEGFIVVVPNTQKGQRVLIRVNAVRGKVSFGEVVEYLKSEENTVELNDDEIVSKKKKSKK